MTYKQFIRYGMNMHKYKANIKVIVYLIKLVRQLVILPEVFLQIQVLCFIRT